MLEEGADASGWSRTQPADCVSVADVLAMPLRVYVACATGHGDVLLNGDGSKWAKITLPVAGVPVTLERLALVQSHVIAVGGSGLYRGPS